MITVSIILVRKLRNFYWGYHSVPAFQHVIFFFNFIVSLFDFILFYFFFICPSLTFHLVVCIATYTKWKFIIYHFHITILLLKHITRWWILWHLNITPTPISRAERPKAFTKKKITLWRSRLKRKKITHFSDRKEILQTDRSSLEFTSAVTMKEGRV